MNKTLFSYFDTIIESPVGIAHTMLNYNTLYTNVSSMLLNGFINYVKPIRAFLLDRYTDGNATCANVGAYDHEEKFARVTNVRKADLVASLDSGKYAMRNTRLKWFGDDIVVLAQVEPSVGAYMFFYFDTDVKYCYIGRFCTDDPRHVVTASLAEWLKCCVNNDLHDKSNTGHVITGYYELPISIFQGWTHF